MMARLKQTVLILLSVLATVALVVLALGWRLTARLENESEILETARGPIEFASVGMGPAVLLVHGAPGGYDQLLPLGRRLAERGFRAISVSRPGYLRTPLTAGERPIEQALALEALLEALGVERASVVAVSGGGPVALNLAASFPERVRTLTLVAALTGPPELDDRAPSESLARFGPFWNSAAIVAAAVPSLGLRILGGKDANLEAREAASYLFQSLGFSWRRGGYRNDVLALFDHGAFPALDEVGVPTLALYAERDQSVPLEHGRSATDEIAGARLEILEGEGHTFFVTRQDWLLAHLVPFLETALGNDV